MRTRAIMVALLLGGGAALAQTLPPPDAARMAAERAAADAMPDTRGTGRFAAIKEIDPTLPGHVVYRPSDLSALGSTKLGVLVWGNGGCSDDGASARLHLAEIASHGYVAIAPGTVLSGPGAPPQPPSPPRAAGSGGKLPPPKTSAEDVRAGIDWALKENARSGSRYYGRINPKMVAVGGHSCGGLQALQLAGDPRVRTVLVHNSGVFADGSNPIEGLKVDKSLLKALHTPVLYVLGGPTDIAYPNGTDDFAKIDGVPAVLLNLPVGHGGTFRQPNGGLVARAAVDWLDWQLRGDATAAKAFVGPDCGLCTDKRWSIERKKL